MTLNRIEKTYRALCSRGRAVTKLFSGNPNEQGFYFPPEILKEVYNRYFETQTYAPHPKGLLKAREAVGRYYEGQGAKVDPENLILTSGTSESFSYLFSVLVSLLAKPGDNVLTPNPAYPLFDDIAIFRGVHLKHYRLNEGRGWRVDLEDLRSKTDDKTRAIVLISPNNPTGSVISEKEIGEIVSWANEKNIPLICDEVFSEFYFGEGVFPRVIRVAAPRLCFTLNGISKMFALPGLKLSWIAVTGEKNLVDLSIDRLETIADTFLSCHIPIQEALPEIFEKGQAFLKSYRKEVGWRRKVLVKLLHDSPSVSFNEPRGGFYAMPKVTAKTALSEEDFVIGLMEEKGVFVHPGYFYDYEKGIHFVVSFLTEEKNLKAGLESLEGYVKGL